MPNRSGPLWPDIPKRDERGTYMYRWFDPDDVLLYVGISQNLRLRLSDHRQHSWWNHWASSVEIDPHFWEPERNIAVAAEHKVIAAERPIFNCSPGFQAHERIPMYLARLGLNPEDYRSRWSWIQSSRRGEVIAPIVPRGQIRATGPDRQVTLTMSADRVREVLREANRRGVLNLEDAVVMFLQMGLDSSREGRTAA